MPPRQGKLKQQKIIMLPDDPNPYPKKLGEHLRDLNVKVTFMRSFKYFAPVNIFKIFFCRLLGYNIVHVHWLFAFPFSWLMKLITYYCRALGYKIVWEVHNIVSHAGGEKETEKSRWFYEHCDGIIFHSNSDVIRVEAMLGVGPKENRVVIYHPNFIDTYENRIGKKKARSVLGIPGEKKVLLCFGQIRKNRGYEYLLKAINGIGDDIFLLIAGEVVDYAEYKFLCGNTAGKESIKVVAKWIGKDEVQNFFNASDVTILPYTDITTSGVIPLSYSFARPVIASAIGGVGEIVIDGKTGYLVNPRDENDLKRAITSIFHTDFEGMGKNAFAFAKESLTWSDAAVKIKKLYQAL